MEELKEADLINRYHFMDESHVDDEDMPYIMVHGVKRSVQWLVVQYLTQLKEGFIQYKTSKQKELFVVITIPAYFGTRQRKLIKQCCMYYVVYFFFFFS